MNENLFHSLVKQASFGYALYETIADSNGLPVDYRFIEVNSVFGEAVGLKVKDLEGKTVSEVFSNVEKPEFNWIAFFKKIFVSKDSLEFEQYFEHLKKWFRIQVQSQGNGIFVVLFFDITEITKIHNALNESELNFRSIFNHTNDAIYIQDKKGIFLDVNTAATKMYGFSLEEMVGKFPDILSAEGRNDEVDVIGNISKAINGTPQKFVWWGKRKNGEIFPQEVILNKGTYYEKEVVYAIVKDVSEKYFALDALKASEDKYRSLTNQLPLGVYRTSTDGQLIFANSAFVNILNYDSAEEILQLNVNQLYANPIEREIQFKDSTSKGEIVQSEFQLRKKTGELIWVRDNCRFIYDKNGNLQYLDGVLEDITARKLTEDKLRKSEARFRSLFDQTHDAVFILDLNGYLIATNKRACEMLGYDEKEITGVSFNETPEDIEKNREIMQNLRMGEKVPLYERTFRRKDGKTLFTEVAVELVCDEAGKPVHVQSVIRDITERKQAEDDLKKSESKLRELNSTKDKFFSIIGHDLKNIFNGILNITDLLAQKTKVNDTEDIEVLCTLLNNTSKNGYSLLENLLHWARVQSGRIEFKPQPFMLKDIINTVVDLQKVILSEKNIFLHTNYDPNIQIFADRFMLETVLRNLISNAIKFSNSGGSVVIEAKQLNGFTRISITDSGIGISSENIPKLFRIETSFTTQGTNQEQGTGLGLILCKEFVDKHGGEIGVESQEGKGSTFFFTIPANNN